MRRLFKEGSAGSCTDTRKNNGKNDPVNRNNLRGNTDFLSRLNWPGTHGKYNVKFVQSQSLKSGIFV